MIATERSVAARAVSIHSVGANDPVGANSVLMKIGSGFTAVAPVRVSRSRWAISRPQTSHDHGS